MRSFLKILIFLFSLSAFSPLYSSPFDDFLLSFQYPSIISKISAVEKREFSRIKWEKGRPIYNDRLIVLYLVASGITEEKDLAGYLMQYQKILDDAVSEIHKKQLTNDYHKAEFLLMYLHNVIFRHPIEGSGAGYNVGIKETLDHKSYNCYKSALIYNAMLSDLGIQSSYVVVPEHIYSLIHLDGVDIEVETTNAYGFDPDHKGYKQYRKIFEPAGYTLNRKKYSRKNPAGPVDVLISVFGNRALLYAGEVQYSGMNVSVDLEKGVALSMIGSYITPDPPVDDFYANLPVLLSRYFDSVIKKNPERIDEEAGHLKKVLDHPLFKKSAAKYYRWFNITTINAMAHLRKKFTAENQGKEPIHFKNFIMECHGRVKKLLYEDKETMNIHLHNMSVDYMNYLRSYYSDKDWNSIKQNHRDAILYFHDPIISGEAKIIELKFSQLRSLGSSINGIMIDSYKQKKMEMVHKVYKEGLALLQSEDGLKDHEPVIQTIKKNYNIMVQ